MLKPTYRLLDLEELKELEPEFVNFLATNGVDAKQWVKIKEEDPRKTQDFICQFSDLVFDKIMTDVRYLNYEEEGKKFFFRCLDSRLELIVLEGLGVDEGSIYSLEKEYNKERNLEIFDMLQMGCVIEDEKKYNAAALAMAESKS